MGGRREMKKSLFALVSLLMLALTFPGMAAADSVLPGTPLNSSQSFSVDLKEEVC
jgi:hypothetical protein